LIQVRFDKPVQIDKLRDVVATTGYEGGEIQQFGAPNEYLIKVEKIRETEFATSKLMEIL